MPYDMFFACAKQASPNRLHTKKQWWLGFCFLALLVLTTPAWSQSSVSLIANSGLAHSADSPTERSQSIYSLFLSHLNPTDLESLERLTELQNLSLYYSQFDALAPLFEDLADLDWTLHFSQQKHQTEINGSRLDIESTAVHFDPFTAVQVKFQNACRHNNPHCFSSPADVLLHELIHVHVALTDPATYIHQGGLSGLLYPYQHERDVIKLERQFYQMMTEQDGFPRPYRSSHSGKARSVSCALCLPGSR